MCNIVLAPIYKEWYVISCIIVQSIAVGIKIGFPAILIPVITSDDSDIRVTKEEASWIAAVNGISGPIGFILLPYLMQVFGRRFTNISVNLFTLIGTITIALAPNYAWLLAGRAIQGIVFCQPIVCSLIIAEYSHPRRRGISIITNMVFILIGVTLCHGLSAKFFWREIAWFFTVPSVIGLVATLAWPESPLWLAYKGRYQECEDAFQWLRGNDHESRKELRELIMAQRELKNLEHTSNSFLKTFKAFRSKKFLKPLFIVMTSICFTQSAGSYYLFGYAIEIMTKLTGDKSQALYFTVGFDLIKLLAALVSIVTVSRFNRRTLVFSSGSLAIVVLGLICLFDYLNHIQILTLPWLPATLLIFYGFVAVSAFSILSVLKGEIFPIQYKGIGTTSSGILASLVVALTMKLTTNMLVSLQTYGTFLVYLFSMAIFLTLFYFILPETKDRTLQNIENEFVNQELTDIEDAGAEVVTILK